MSLKLKGNADKLSRAFAKSLKSAKPLERCGSTQIWKSFPPPERLSD
jgi:hypothetical protein